VPAVSSGAVEGLYNDALKELKLATPSITAASAVYRTIETDLYMEDGLIRLAERRLEAAAESFQRVLAIDANHDAAKRQLAALRKRLQNQTAKKKPAPRQRRTLYAECHSRRRLQVIRCVRRCFLRSPQT
jgi:tetratricopeptide (TPR) repeat protein